MKVKFWGFYNVTQKKWFTNWGYKGANRTNPYIELTSDPEMALGLNRKDDAQIFLFTLERCTEDAVRLKRVQKTVVKQK